MAALHAWPWRQTLFMAVKRPRQVQVQPFPSSRRLVTAAMRAGRRMAPMYGLVDVDVTEANRILCSRDPPWSLTAFVVASVARAAGAHPEVHAYRNWRGQLVTHRHVDVTTMVEISTPQGLFGLPYVLRDADVREVEVRDVLDLTVVIDHNVVDGAPASRFGAELRQLIETAAVISSSS